MLFHYQEPDMLTIQMKYIENAQWKKVKQMQEPDMLTISPLQCCFANQLGTKEIALLFRQNILLISTCIHTLR